MINKIIKIVTYIPEKVIIGIINIYQFFLSTDHAFWSNPNIFRICTYKPSCSEFTKQSIIKHGIILGSLMGIKRVIDCNPFSKGGYDPVPNKFTLKRYQGKDAKPAYN